MNKDEVRRRSEEAGLKVHDKPDSQEICFVPDNNYRNFLKKAAPEAIARIGEGDIVDTSGNVLGKHGGTPNYTVGQRRGIGIAHSEPLYVLEIDPDANVVVVGTHDEQGSPALEAAQINWQIPLEKLADEMTTATDGTRELAVKAQIRYRSPAVDAVVKIGSDPSQVEVTFAQKVNAVTPGQAVVFYDQATNEIVLGGGWIVRAL
jgi:tRNA-specific 2-thiouridylase